MATDPKNEHDSEVIVPAKLSPLPRSKAVLLVTVAAGGAAASSLLLDGFMAWTRDTRTDLSTIWFLAFFGIFFIFSVLIIMFGGGVEHERS